MNHPETTMSLTVKVLGWLDKRSPIGVSLVGVMFIVCLGLLSNYTGTQLSSSFLYLIPILLVTRVTGFRAGVFAALLAVSMWLAADLNTGIQLGHPFIPYWNALMRLGTFLVAVGLVSAMRSMNAHLEERVHDRTAALEAQIAEKRELEKTILEISDRERATIGQDLHDGLCQQLVSAAFSANMLQEELAKESDIGAIHTNRIADMIDDAINQARNLARGLYPVRLESEGLEMALRELASTMNRRFGIECSVECQTPLPPCKTAVGIQLYRIAQEAVVNAAKHSNTRNVIISISSGNSRVKLMIEDDGSGISPTSINPEGMGLRIMEYRARMIGADFKIASHLDGGTRLTCELGENEFKA